MADGTGGPALDAVGAAVVEVGKAVLRGAVVVAAAVVAGAGVVL